MTKFVISRKTNPEMFAEGDGAADGQRPGENG
jgi:hypothetical protein